MEARPQLELSMQEQQIRAALDQHWAASDANDFETEHRIYGSLLVVRSLLQGGANCLRISH